MDEIKTEINALILNDGAAAQDSSAIKGAGKKRAKKEKGGSEFKATADELEALRSLKGAAQLMRKSLKQVTDESIFHQISFITERLTKVIVRFNVTDKELEAILRDCKRLRVGGVLVSPAYLPSVKKQIKRLDYGEYGVGSLIDFPFGESLLKSKLNDIRDSKKLGANGVTVTIPSMLLESDKRKTLKKELAKYAGAYSGRVTVAFNGTDLPEDKIRAAIKATERLKIEGMAFTFGDISLVELKIKMAEINKHKGRAPIKILANVESAEAARELVALGADEVLTPYADEIARSLVKRFSIDEENLS